MWSCWDSYDNFGCDLFIFVDENGWVTHVSSYRIVGDAPKVDWPESFPEGEAELDAILIPLVEQQNARLEWLDKAVREPIGLPYDGQIFTDNSLEALHKRLIHLRESGYRIPNEAFEDILAEIKQHRRLAGR